MQDYTPNSNRFKNNEVPVKPEHKDAIKPITNGKRQEKSRVRKFIDFFKPDVDNLGHYIMNDVVKPACKQFVDDMVHTVLYGSPSARNTKRSTAESVSYRSYYDKPANVIPSKNQYRYDDIVVTSKEEADAVFTRMTEIIDQYGRTSVADLYNLVSISPAHTDFRYGWTNLSTASTVRVRGGGYMLQLPPAIVLER